MSSAIAATLTLPAAQNLLIFTTLGLGMSAPYLLLSFNPKLLKLLPRPGAWMETFKQLMAFPLFASVVWLTRVFARQMGMEPMGLTLLMNLLWGLLFVGFAFWALTRVGAARSKFGRSMLMVTSLFSAGIALFLAYPLPQAVEASRARAVQPAGSVEMDSHGLSWESYSPARVAELSKAGRAVFIDFTAEWCITCQVNKEVVFSSTRVRELLATKNVALILGDWTSMNPLVTEGLAKYGRNGVPLNVLIPTKTGSAPILFPNILSAGSVIEELEKL
jgi:thiol:disulfide interchange protein DsbD